ncbi:hypothetical protein QT971_11180 [Microcoleus sp. herbarium19]|uniref:hypothetical protein n=1 Tax=unclassified Microcoleus TaxID=2642155 RepID=UPI002FD68836
MKLCLPFFCVALLGVGMMPVAAAPRNFSEGTNLDRTEAEPAISEASISPSINHQPDDSPQPLTAIASEIPPDRPILEKPEVKSGKFALKLPAGSENQKPNSHSYLDASHSRRRETPLSNPRSAEVQPLVPIAEIPRLNQKTLHL